MKGIEAVCPGVKTSDIAKAVQKHVEDAGLSVVRELVGHGVGFAIHEEPQVPNFFDRRLPDTVLESGMVIAIEPMVILVIGRLIRSLMGGQLSPKMEVTQRILSTLSRLLKMVMKYSPRYEIIRH